MKSLFRRYGKVHLVGIGGVGMEGLAYVLQALGCQVSGSDRAPSRALEQLRRAGISAALGHRAESVQGRELVVYSAAVPPDNPELLAAAAAGIPVVGRAQLLGELTRPYWTVAVAGSHGKTTTAAMTATILRGAGCEPSALIGGWLEGRAAAWLGRGGPFVVEADEYQRSFLQLRPQAAIVTTIDAEHLDCYRDLAEVEETFGLFLGKLPFYGHCAMGGDDPGVRRLLPRLGRPVRTFGLGEDNQVRAVELETRPWGSCFTLVGEGVEQGRIELQVPGLHNVCNALGAAAMAQLLEIDFVAVAAALAGFAGVGRRFERRGEGGGILVVDDYAHHPAEIAATLQAARGTGRRVVAVFQPHLYSRTRALIREFAESLQAADQVYLAAIYGSREEAQPDVDAGQIAQAMRANGYERVEYVPQLEELPRRVLAACRPGDLVLTMGAGDVDRVAEGVLAALKTGS
ncbi:MAG: UDP-N-acetylmuramate--L-alanine ligase [Candidatus Handelsmanbacteria bacterium]|nr:UDP-N-acetylmuramate--L-alanine ligase [Candidatus Handelsmanbacteria bacterium]